MSTNNRELLSSEQAIIHIERIFIMTGKLLDEIYTLRDESDAKVQNTTLDNTIISLLHLKNELNASMVSLIQSITK